MFYVIFLENVSICYWSSLTCPELCEVGGPNVTLAFYRWGDWGREKFRDLPKVIKLVGNQSSEQKGSPEVLRVLSWSHRQDKGKHVHDQPRCLQSRDSEVALSPWPESHRPGPSKAPPASLAVHETHHIFSTSVFPFPHRPLTNHSARSTQAAHATISLLRKC